MQFLTSLFGGSENSFVTAALALGIVLVLIVLALWVLKISFRASNQLIRRNKRLTIIDSINVDAKRQLIIVRRDNVEHLILTGGPTDVVVEAGIAAEKPGMPMPRRAAVTTPPGGGGGQAERPQATQPVNDALEAAQALTATAPARGPMERLRELAGPLKERRGPSSLRHTGLMRPVSRMEPAAVIPINPDNLDRRRVDSAKTGPSGMGSEQSELGGNRHLGNGVKAEGS
jgi:flagellar protein FliO/FliZ